MRSTKADLIATIENISSVSILVIGDLILDRYVWGKVDRISPEAPVPVVDIKKMEDRIGGAGNVAANLRSIGCNVNIIGFVGDDEEGRALMRLFAENRAATHGIVIDGTQPTALKTRVIAQAQQIVRIDREYRGQRDPHYDDLIAEAAKAEIGKANAVILSDYGKGVVSEKLCDTIESLFTEGKLSAAKRPLVVDPHPRNYNLYKRMSVVKPNRKEAEQASGIKIESPETALQSARIIRDRWKADMVVITLGEDGLVILPPKSNEGIFLDTVAQDVFDVSGAGDTVTALLTAALASGASPELAGDLANIGAGIVVSEIGTIPISLSRLHDEAHRLGLE